jgi:hypothetical protein
MNMHEVVLESPDRLACEDLGEALRSALFSALKGRAATVFHRGEAVWEVQVGSSDPYNGHAIVRFLLKDEPQSWKDLYEYDWPAARSDKT